MKSVFRNWQDVRVFLAVMRAGSTLAASRSLDMSQPTVARRIEVLEHETGLTLFRRDTRGFCPTPAASALMPLAEAMETAAQGFAKKADELGRPETRAIRITAGSPNFSPRLAKIFAEFAETHPEVRFEFLPTLRTLDLSAGEADIALRLAARIDDPALICRRISTARYTFYASRRYAETRSMPRSAEDLAGHSFVSFQTENVSTRLHDWLARRVDPGQIVTARSDIDSMVTAIQSGLGIGILNVSLAEGFDDLVQCFVPPEEFSVPHWMLVSPEAYKRPEVKAFTAFFAPRYAAIFRK